MVVGRIVLILGLVWLSGNSLYMCGEGKGDLHMYEQRGLGSACASAQSDQSLLCSDQQEIALKQSKWKMHFKFDLIENSEHVQKHELI